MGMEPYSYDADMPERRDVDEKWRPLYKRKYACRDIT